VTARDNSPPKRLENGKIDNEDEDKKSAPEELRSLVVKMMVEQISGRRIDWIDAEELLSPKQESGAAATGSATAEPGFALFYGEIERESIEFSASGSIRTADGLQIDFSLELSMSRERTTLLGIEGGGGVVKDPLVIDFSGRGAELLDQKGWFDLNRDGEAEEVAMLAPGGAYLALDHNRNGKIDDGGELFGPSSGDGFAELRRYDSDGNQWIDSADPVFNRLALWFPARDGGLQSLTDRGVAAIHLGTISTRFELVGQSESLGRVRESGLYLGEGGRVGAVQQIDLVV
jgi:hypothetical protein